MPAGQLIVFPPVSSVQQFASIGQLKQALSVVDPTGLVKLNLPDDSVHPITIGWYEDQFPNAGALYNFIASQLGYTTSQMINFYNSLSNYPVRP